MEVLNIRIINITNKKNSGNNIFKSYTNITPTDIAGIEINNILKSIYGF